MPYIDAMQAYFFDLDGTLTDSRAGLYPAFRRGLETIGVPVVSDAQLKKFLGTPLPQVFRAMRPDVSQIEIDHGMAAFRALFERTGIVANELYPGVIELLRGVQKRGSAIWIVTSKPQNQAIEVVRYLKLDNYVAGVIGAGLAETDTKTDLVGRALVAAQVDSGEAVMVGDRSYDVIGAIENGVLPIGALWGYGSEDELKNAGCQHFAKSPDDFRMAYVETRAGFTDFSLTAAAARY
ncbi:HAD hydrolase-like protein [uncultured Bradyrhizobium sp.]|jgi:phosphoglycolate phosphatase|uniref:HAD hydrolase-like protein n=1 Tax=uncultured Bradyrhizobium sp. TaxID=199684 RepID=UPI00262B43C6|nr:HAD hydrolase-like protein [uncultured Bradyrhizobium sp.]